MNVQTLIHRWANQVKPSGKCGNVFYEGRALYSYGKHYMLGYLVSHPKLDGPDAPTVALVNGLRYSPSTTRHQSYTHAALRGGPQIIHCSDIKTDHWGGHASLLRTAENEASGIENAAACLSPRSPAASKKLCGEMDFSHGVLRQLVALCPDAAPLLESVAAAMSRTQDPELLASIDKHHQKRAQMAAERQRRLQLSRRNLYIEELTRIGFVLPAEFGPEQMPDDVLHEAMQNAWRAGLTKMLPPTAGLALLRPGKEGGAPSIQTTLGMNVPIRHLAGAYRLLKDCMAKEVAGYPVVACSGERVKIGCHVITWNEIDLLVSKLSPETRALIGA